MRKGKKRKRRRESGKPRSIAPPYGSTVLHCGHMGSPESMHWWHLEVPAHAEFPNGTTGEVDWVTACDACYLRAGGKEGMIMRNPRYGVWEGGGMHVEPGGAS